MMWHLVRRVFVEVKQTPRCERRRLAVVKVEEHSAAADILWEGDAVSAPRWFVFKDFGYVFFEYRFGTRVSDLTRVERGCMRHRYTNTAAVRKATITGLRQVTAVW